MNHDKAQYQDWRVGLVDMRLVFMRVKNGRLNPDDTYRSKWIGGHGGGAETLYAANGQPVIGVYGRQGHDLDAIGFIQVDETAVK